MRTATMPPIAPSSGQARFASGAAFPPPLLLAALALLAVLAATAASASPTLTLTSPASSSTLTNQAHLTIVATVAPANSSVLLNGTPLAPNATGAVASNVSLREGLNTFFLNATDWMNATSSLEFYVVLDTVPPVLDISSPVEGKLTNADNVTVWGTVNPWQSTVTVNGNPAATDPSGNFSFTVALADGLNVIRIGATDPAGNFVQEVRNVTLDRYPPYLAVDTPVNGTLTNRTTVDVVGRTEREARVTVNGFPAAVNSTDGTFTYPGFQLEDLFDVTENLLVIRAVDLAGNVMFANRTVFVDTRAPSIVLSFDPEIQARIDANEPIATKTITIRGTTDSSDAVIWIRGVQANLTGLSFSEALTLVEGPNDLMITAHDAAGNDVSIRLYIEVDTVAPTLVMDAPNATALITNQTSLQIVGHTDSADAVVSVTYPDPRGVSQTDAVTTVPVGQPADYQFDYTLVLNADGNPHSVVMRAVDRAGNSNSSSFSYTTKIGRPFLEIDGFEAVVTQPFVWVNGTTEGGIDVVRVNGNDYAVAAENFAVRLDLANGEGNYTISVSVQDVAGNMNAWTGTVWYHRPFPPSPPPVLPVSLRLQVNGSLASEVAAGANATFTLDLSNGTAYQVSWLVDGTPAGVGGAILLNLAPGVHYITANVSNGVEARDYAFVVVAVAPASGPAAAPAASAGDGLLLLVVFAAAGAAAAAIFLLVRRAP